MLSKLPESIRTSIEGNTKTAQSFFFKWRKTIIFIICLAVILSLGISFAVVPAIGKLQDTRKEIADLEADQRMYAEVIDNKNANEEQSMTATAELNDAAAFFGTPMKAEELDEYVTKILLKCGMTSNSMTISDLEQGMPKPFKAPAESAESAMPDSNKISSYTINVSAICPSKSLYALLDEVEAMPGLELVSYEWIASATTAGSSVSKQTISLVLKLYVI